MGNYSALEISHDVLKKRIQPGDFCIDATAGRGYDTVFLSELVGEEGNILAFDVQQEALDSTQQRVEEQGCKTPVTYILDSHSNMEEYAEAGSVAGIVFNFGWLPKGNHAIQTRPESSIPAIEAGLRLLKKGGIMSLCIYYGKDSGYEERDALLSFFPTLDTSQYTVLVTQFVNRPNDPPIPVFITKD